MPADPAATPAAPSPAPPTAPLLASPAPPAAHQHEGSVKETIESILVAFILAFIFRAFVVEAFVIPTGSMAPTLLGAHMRFTCHDCGYRFTANYSPPNRTGSDDMYIPSVSAQDYTVVCPNCGFRLPQYDPTDPANDSSTPPVNYG